MSEEDKGPSPLDISATMDRMERGIAPGVSADVALASIAVSLKEIARNSGAILAAIVHADQQAESHARMITSAIDRHSQRPAPAQNTMVHMPPLLKVQIIPEEEKP